MIHKKPLCYHDTRRYRPVALDWNVYVKPIYINYLDFSGRILSEAKYNKVLNLPVRYDTSEIDSGAPVHM